MTAGRGIGWSKVGFKSGRGIASRPVTPAVAKRIGGGLKGAGVATKKIATVSVTQDARGVLAVVINNTRVTNQKPLGIQRVLYEERVLVSEIVEAAKSHAESAKG